MLLFLAGAVFTKDSVAVGRRYVPHHMFLFCLYHLFYGCNTRNKNRINNSLANIQIHIRSGARHILYAPNAKTHNGTHNTYIDSNLIRHHSLRQALGYRKKYLFVKRNRQLKITPEERNKVRYSTHMYVAYDCTRFFSSSFFLCVCVCVCVCVYVYVYVCVYFCLCVVLYRLPLHTMR